MDSQEGKGRYRKGVRMIMTVSGTVLMLISHTTTQSLYFSSDHYLNEILIYYSVVGTNQETTSTICTVRGKVHAWLFDSIDKTLSIVTVLPSKVT